MVDLEQFREAVECWRDAALPANDVEAERKAKARHLLSIIDSGGKVEVPRNRTEAASLARRILEQLGVIDAHIDAAIARCEAASPKQPAAVDGAWETAPPDLYNEISSVLNKHSAESGSNTPDYVLAQFLLESMTAFNAATNRRDAHYNGSAIAGDVK